MIPGFTADYALGAKNQPYQQRLSSSRRKDSKIVPATMICLPKTHRYPCYQHADGTVGYCTEEVMECIHIFKGY